MGTTSIDLLRRLREHQIWVREKLLVAAHGLTPAQLARAFPIGQGSMLATLVHLYAAEFVWLSAIEGEITTISPFAIKFETLDALEAAWKVLDGRWERFYRELNDRVLEQSVTKRPSSGGPATSTSLTDVLMHLALHASHTAAQAINIFRQLGVSPLPDPMLISLSRLQSSRTQHP